MHEIEKGYLDSFFDELNTAVERAGNINRLSRMTGVPFMSLKRWVGKECSPTLEGIAKLLPFIDWPKRGNSRPLLVHIEEPQRTEEVKGDDLVRIPVQFKAGAGNPVEFWDEEPERWIEVLPRYARNGVRGIEVNGDSMEPTIRDGSIVGVVPFDGNFSEGKIYLCRIPYFGLVIKRVRMNGMKGITLISDNKQYEDMHIPFEDCEGLVVGRVVWYWQEA